MMKRIPFGLLYVLVLSALASFWLYDAWRGAVQQKNAVRLAVKQAEGSAVFVPSQEVDLLALVPPEHGASIAPAAVGSALPAGAVVVRAEVAATEAQHEKGLMFRTQLAEDAGMLFVFSNRKEHAFWMRNTYIPLDMIFLDNGVVVGVVANARPLDETPLSAGVPSTHVLEVPAGFAARHGVAGGWRMLRR